jgi:hypothetical protein
MAERQPEVRARSKISELDQDARTREETLKLLRRGPESVSIAYLGALLSEAKLIREARFLYDALLKEVVCHSLGEAGDSVPVRDFEFRTR